MTRWKLRLWHRRRTWLDNQGIVWAYRGGSWTFTTADGLNRATRHTPNELGFPPFRSLT